MKRWTLRILILLFLGAIVNVAVAWGCGYGFGGHSRSGSAREMHGEDLGWWRSNAPTGYESIYEMEQYDLYEGFGRQIAQWPQFPRAATSEHVVMRDRSGWPLLALERSQWLDPRGAIQKDAWNIPYIDDKRERDIVALRPLWPGFAINTVFYAAILWLLFFALGRIRRAVRIKRGRCPKCGYDLRGSVLPSPAGRGAGGEGGQGCPECGWGR